MSFMETMDHSPLCIVPQIAPGSIFSIAPMVEPEVTPCELSPL